MANKAYNRSATEERRLVNQLRAEGYIAARSAGSKSSVDVWAFDPLLKQLRMYQVKTQRGGRNIHVITELVWEGTTAVLYSYLRTTKKKPQKLTEKEINAFKAAGRKERSGIQKDTPSSY